MPVFTNVLGEVVIERMRQDRQWGGPAHDDLHQPCDFIGFIETRITKSRFVESTDSGRARFIKIAALAVAAVQAIDRRG